MAVKKNTKEKLPAVNLPSELNTQLPAELSVNPSVQAELIEICNAVGSTREHLIKTLHEATNATKTIVDKYGEEHTDADHDKRIKGAMALLELRGDIKNKTIANDNSKHTHVTYSWQPVQVINK